MMAVRRAMAHVQREGGGRRGTRTLGLLHVNHMLTPETGAANGGLA